MGVNFYTCVKKFRADGTKMSFGDLFNFSRALDKIIGPIIVGILIGLGFICLIIPNYTNLNVVFHPLRTRRSHGTIFYRRNEGIEKAHQRELVKNHNFHNYFRITCYCRYLTFGNRCTGYYPCGPCCLVLCL